MNAKNLLIIGNGFDLKCDLKSSYTNFFESKEMCEKQEIAKQFLDSFILFDVYSSDFNSRFPVSLTINDNNLYNFKKKNSELNDNNSFNLWNLVFIKPESTDLNWNNVEKIIEDIVCNSKDSNVTIKIIEKYYKILTEREVMSNRITVTLKGNQKKNFALALYLFSKNPDIENIFLYLLDELKKFENQFYLYLNQEVDSNDDYHSNIRFLLEDINKDISNVINFNYTTVKDRPNVNIESNVHGSLDTGNIIFGIDLSNLTTENGSFYFTKTYRKMHAFENITINNFQKQSVLDRNIESISFYGHSLNESDYSYFQSIFDFYEVYSSNISLVFYYSIYDPKQTKVIKENYTNAVINLLNIYGKTMANEFHGKNFLHKLMLENRVILKKV